MIHKQTLQSGSAALIIILILALILTGALGYTWWQNGSRIKPLDSDAATNVQKNTPSSDGVSSNITQDKNYLVIKEWGVKLKTSASEHLIYKAYSMTDVRSPEAYDVLGLTIKSSSVTNQDCVNFGADLYRQHTPSDRFRTKKIGDYYYYVTGAPGVCSDEPSDAQLQQKVLTDLDIANLYNI